MGCALLLLTVYTYFIQLPGWNELSRLDLTVALARDHTARIDAYSRNTGDKAEYNGHVYSDKAPGLSLLAVPAFLLLDRLEGRPAFDDVKADFRTYTLSAFAVALPSTALALLFYRFLLALQPNRRGRDLAMAALYALGSLALPFSTMLFSHQTSAALCFATFYLVFRAARLASPVSHFTVLTAAGLLAGLAVLVEYPNALAVGAVGVYAWARLGRRAWPFALGALPGGLALLGYDAWAFGSPWRLGYQFVSAQTFGGAHTGFFGLRWPSPLALAAILAGSRGLLTFAPWLALAPLGWVALRRQRCRRAEAHLLAAVPLLFLAYNSTYYQPLGGWSPGPRFLVPALPFAAALAALAPSAWDRLLWPLGLWSVAVMGLATAFDAAPNDHITNLLAHWWRLLLQGNPAATQASHRYGLQGYASLLPLACALVVGAALISRRLRVARRRSDVQPPAFDLGPAALEWAVLALGVAAYVALGGPVDWLRPGEVPRAYRQDAGLAASIQRLVRVRYGDEVELVGYDLAPRLLRPGDVAALRLYWRALRPLGRDYTVFVHLVAADGQTAAGIDRQPVGGTYATSLWPAGYLVQDPYRLPVRAGAAAPALLRLEVGLYEGTPDKRLAAFDAGGAPLGAAPPVGRVALRPSAAPTLPAVAGQPVVFGHAVELLDARLEEPAGGRVAGTLLWRALRPLDEDYTVFVQALDGAGRLAAQWDAQPEAGQFPTSFWPPGQVVPDSFHLEGLRPGRYTLIAGLYTAASGARLRTGADDHAVLREVAVHT